MMLGLKSKVGDGICETPADFENTQLKWSYPLSFNADSLTPPIPSTKGSRAGRRGGGVQYDRLIDVLTVQCNSVALEIIGWSFSSPARSTDD